MDYIPKSSLTMQGSTIQHNLGTDTSDRNRHVRQEPSKEPILGEELTGQGPDG